MKRIASNSQKVEVHSKVEVILTEIDDVAQTFGTDFNLKFAYTLPKRYEIDIGNHELEDWVVIPGESMPWRPKWILYNIMDTNLLEETFYFQASSRTVAAVMNWLFTHKDLLELKRFPFDSQKFDITFAITNPEGVAVPAEHMPFPKSEDFNEDKDLYFESQPANWSLIDLDMKVDGRIQVVIYMQRKAAFYLWNIVSPTFVIVLCNSLTAAIDRSDVADRLANTITLFLTAVAFKFVVLQYLPSVPYLTWMDIYMLIGFGLLVVGAFETFLISPLFIAEEDQDTAEEIDRWFNGIVLVLWVLFHLVVILVARFEVFSMSVEQIDETQMEPDGTEFNMPRDKANEESGADSEGGRLAGLETTSVEANQMMEKMM